MSIITSSIAATPHQLRGQHAGGRRVLVSTPRSNDPRRRRRDARRPAAKAVGRAYKIAPAQITANQNDYSPTDLAIAEHVNLTSDAARSITGSPLGAINRELTLRNKGSFNITLVASKRELDRGNRFDFGADDVVLRPATPSAALRRRLEPLGQGRRRHQGVADRRRSSCCPATSTPAQITSNQNDYAPAGVDLASRCCGSTPTPAATSPASSIRATAALKILVNVGSNAIVLKNADAGSSAANRFDFGADVTLSAKQSHHPVRRDRQPLEDARQHRRRRGRRWRGDGGQARQAPASAHGPIVNGYLEWTVAGNALTVALKTLAGTDPTASDPVRCFLAPTSRRRRARSR
jgi:hypothetical protein